MATKPQVVAAIDAIVLQIKSDIANILPSGVNIRAVEIRVGPTDEYTIVLNAMANTATAQSWATAITTNLTNASRAFVVRGKQGRRSDDLTTTEDHEILILGRNGNILTVQIINF